MDAYFINGDAKNTSIKQKILMHSLDLFSTKGYTETSIRDIAKSVGINTAMVYGIFASKEDILVYMLNDYAEYTKKMYFSQDHVSILRENPTSEGITECIMSSIAILTENECFLKLFHLVHVEQHRINLFGDFLLIRFQQTKGFVVRIIDALKKLNIIQGDINAEYWGVTIFSLLYALSNTMAIHNRQNTKGYTNKDIADIVRYMSEIMINTYKSPDFNIPG